MGMEENEGAVRLYSVGFLRALPTPDKHLSAHPAFQPTHKVPVSRRRWSRDPHDAAYTYCMPLRCVTQPLVVSIAPNQHPVSYRYALL